MCHWCPKGSSKNCQTGRRRTDPSTGLTTFATGLPTARPRALLRPTSLDVEEGYSPVEPPRGLAGCAPRPHFPGKLISKHDVRIADLDLRRCPIFPSRLRKNASLSVAPKGFLVKLNGLGPAFLNDQIGLSPCDNPSGIGLWHFPMIFRLPSFCNGEKAFGGEANLSRHRKGPMMGRLASNCQPRKS